MEVQTIAHASGRPRPGSQSFNQPADLGKRALIFNHMVELETPQLDAVFHALGDATRRRMLRELARGERTVGQLAEPFAISPRPPRSTWRWRTPG